MHHYFKYNSRSLVMAITLAAGYLTISQKADAQATAHYNVPAVQIASPNRVPDSQATLHYKAPQDTVTMKRSRDESLTIYKTIKQPFKLDSRMVGAAVRAADILKDSTQYDTKKGVPLEQLFGQDDIEYVAKQGIGTVVILFELINKYLPKGRYIAFRTEQEDNVTVSENPLVLKDLRAIISAKPATIQSDQPQWKENVYQAYMARDYGTKLDNTITITSATREMRETPELEIIDFEGKIKLNEILTREQAKINNKYEAEKAAVAYFRTLTIPGDKISKEVANENYRRALFELMRLQESDIDSHPATKKLLADLALDLKKGRQSNIINALKNSSFFDANVPGNLGPVLLTEDQVINANQIRNNAEPKALELIMLTALHYGERDAVKLFKQLISNQGSVPAQQTADFSPKRLKELTDHGTEKLKSLGYGTDKTANMTSADLVLVAVAAPEAPVLVQSTAFINLHEAGESIVKQYSILDVQETKDIILFSPRIKIGSQHAEYRSAFDPVDFVPEFLNGAPVNQKGSRVVQNGIEFRLESDLYFSNVQKIIKKGVKPVIYPEFGIIVGTGARSVGYDNSTTAGPFGAVPKFRNDYFTWGSHVGLNVGPFLLSADATIVSTPENADPYKRFFDLSQGMTYYRYSLLAHIMNFGIGKVEQGKGAYILLDAEFAGETNNEVVNNNTYTQNTGNQIGSGQWQRDYDRAHPNGQLDYQIANTMILNGDVKASYSAANFAAIHLGLQKSNFQVKGTLGVYNLYTVSSHAWVNRELFENTIKGNLFGAVGLTYNFGSRSLTEKRRKKETYESIDNKESPHTVEESSSRQQSLSGPRDHAIFTNKKSRIKPPVLDIR